MANEKMNTSTDYDLELQDTDKSIAGLQGSAFSIPIDAEKATKYVYRLYHRAALSADLSDFRRAQTGIETAIGYLGPAPDLYLLRANLHFKLHQLAESRNDLQLGRGLRDSPDGRALLADLEFQEGRYGDARARYELLLDGEPTWDHFARLAHLEAKMGNLSRAEHLYNQAEEELTAKEMRSFAWLELQRGLLDLTHGRLQEAEEHYRRADRGYSGYWLVDEHIAELLGAQGRFEEAAALYETVAMRVPKPELWQALGELYAFMGMTEQAERWHERALVAYLESAQHGEVHYYHHLADFYADVRKDAVAALKWARKDLELRDNFSTQAAFAWALYLNGQVAEASETISRALCPGVREAELFFQAGTIYQAAGRKGEGKRYLQMALDVNPEFRSFHVHH